jgi:hypothetical protein
MITEEQLKGFIKFAINRKVSPPLSDPEWKFLELEGHIDRIKRAANLQRERLVGDAARSIRNQRAAQGSGEPARPMASGLQPPSTMRTWVLSRLMACEAARDERVRSYRESYLKDRLLTWDEVGDWIEQKAEEQPAVTQYLKVALPPGSSVRLTEDGVVVEPALEHPIPANTVDVTSNAVVFARPGDQSTTRVPTREGALDDLHAVAQHLMSRYGWTDDQATMFVLTGMTPLLNPVWAGLRYESEIPAASRITLVIDPVLTQQEVAENYARLRQQMVGGRYRPQSEERLALALFAAEHGRLAWMNAEVEQPTWKELLALWNRENPDQAIDPQTGKPKYDEEKGVANFARDCKVAQTRLLFPRFSAVEGAQLYEHKTTKKEGK